MIQLNKDNLFTCRNHIDGIINHLGNKRSQLYSQRLISQSDFFLLGSIERKLIDIKDEITLQIIDGILVNVNSSQVKIDQATVVINNRIEALDKINEALALFANIINLFSGILGGIITKTIPDLESLLTPFLN